MHSGGGDEIRQIRIDGSMSAEEIARFPAPGKTPTLVVQVRDQEGKCSPWAPARVAWVEVDGGESLGLVLHVNIALSLDLPPEPKADYRHVADTMSGRQRSTEKMRARVKGRPKLSAYQRKERNAAIRVRRLEGATHDELAVEFNLSRTTVGTILDGLKPAPEEGSE